MKIFKVTSIPLLAILLIKTTMVVATGREGNLASQEKTQANIVGAGGEMVVPCDDNDKLFFSGDGPEEMMDAMSFLNEPFELNRAIFKKVHQQMAPFLLATWSKTTTMANKDVFKKQILSAEQDLLTAIEMLLAKDLELNIQLVNGAYNDKALLEAQRSLNLLNKIQGIKSSQFHNVFWLCVGLNEITKKVDERKAVRVLQNKEHAKSR